MSKIAKALISTLKIKLIGSSIIMKILNNRINWDPDDAKHNNKLKNLPISFMSLK